MGNIVLTQVGINHRMVFGGVDQMLKINITLPENFLKELDKAAKDEKLSRSEFIRKAIQSYWELQKQKIIEKKRAQNIKEAIEIQDRLRVKSGNWDGVAEVRKWREAKWRI